jgi:hypothetical protein
LLLRPIKYSDGDGGQARLMLLPYNVLARHSAASRRACALATLTPASNPCDSNFSVRQFSVTVRTTWSEAPSGRSAEISSVTVTLVQLTAALAAGGDLPTLVEAVRDRERRRAALAERLANLGQTLDVRVRDVCEVERQALEKLRDWRGLLRGDVTEARAILRPVVEDRITFVPAEVAGQRGYRYTGQFTLGPFFEGLCPRALVSPTEPGKGVGPIFRGLRPESSHEPGAPRPAVRGVRLGVSGRARPDQNTGSISVRQ